MSQIIINCPDDETREAVIDWWRDKFTGYLMVDDERVLVDDEVVGNVITVRARE